jgi:glycosyltransferase involved in cell wall biosynthesis
MKIIWIVNIITPQIALAMGLKNPIYGGWIEGLSKQIIKIDNIDLYIIFPFEGKKIIKGKLDKFNYYGIPSDEMVQKKIFKKIHDEIKPDVIHIHGTEYDFGAKYIEENKADNYIVSVQGLISVYARYYYAGLSQRQIINSITLRDLIRKDTIYHQKIKFEKRGIREIDLIKKTKYILGRTDWDRAHVCAINKEINYYYCGEILRDPFYEEDNSWKYEATDKYSIYISQGNYPIKGLHKLFEAIKLLKEDFPEMKVRIGGYDVTLKSKKILDRLKITGYGNLLNKIIKNYDLLNNVKFIGELNENEVVEELRKCHIFICSSVVENSPNAFCEAQILGVPTIATFCGGLPTLIKDKNSTILVNFDETEMLAMYIKKLFVNRELCENLSAQAKTEAIQRHDKLKISEQLIDIYNEIIQKNEYN